MHFHLRESKGFDPDRVEDYSVMMVPDCGGEEGTQSEIYLFSRSPDSSYPALQRPEQGI